MLFDEIARTSTDVSETRARSAKVERLAACLRELRADEVRAAVTFLSGGLPRIGVGWASLRDLPEPTPRASLEVLDVDAALGRVAASSGRGSQETRRGELGSVFALATEREQTFLRGILHGELRQGALEGIMVDAVARAAEVPAVDVRRALMLAGELPPWRKPRWPRASLGSSAFGSRCSDP